jgi:Right handed beta helix region
MTSVIPMSILAVCACVQAAPSPAIVVAVGDNLQSAVDRNGPGATFRIRAGVHRLQSVQPKAGNTFEGEPGAILSGAIELTGFHAQGGLWVASVKAQPSESKGECRDGFPACNLPEDLFVDDVPLRRVQEVEQVRPGKWYLDYARNLAYVAENPRGRRIEMSVARFAIAGAAPNVTIRDLTIEKYATVTGVGAIHSGVPSSRGQVSGNWVVSNNEIRWNHGTGVRLGDGMRLVHNRLLHNGHMGAGGTGDDVLVEANEIAFNNFAGYDYHWGAGGAKFVLSDRLRVRENYVHNNEGPGLWADIDCHDVIFEHNRTAANKVAGIFFEISSGAIVRDNQIENEGENPAREGVERGAGILVNTSSNVEVSENVVKGCPNGILALQQDRGKNQRTGALRVLKNLYVHGNTITQNAGLAAGIRSSMTRPGIDPSNRFESNVYQLRNSSAPLFVWDDGVRTISQWQAAGNDRSGQFGAIP